MIELPVYDFYNRTVQIKRPNMDSRFKYDFDVKAPFDDFWLYLNSFDDMSSPIVKNQVSTVIESGGAYRIVESATGNIIEIEGKV